MNPESTQPTAAELLAEASWARSLAGRLVGDAAAADDAVQEALLAAVRRPPQGADTAAWFAKVVTNAARMGRRGTSRRQRREHRAAREEALPSAEELVAKAEAQRALVDAVLRLDEPYRATVLLRYFEDLGAAEIARRQGIPAGTVRWRLVEGLKRLRAGLEAKFDGDPRAWCLALLPLVDRAGRLAIAGSSSLLSLGWMLMTLKTFSVLGVAGLLWLLADQAGWLSGSDTPDPDRVIPEVVGFRPIAVNEPPREERVPAEPGAARPVGSRADDFVEVQVQARLVDPHGAPLAGGRLLPVQWMGLRQRADAVGSSDADGRAVLRWRVVPAAFGERGFSAEFLIRCPGCANERREAVVYRDRLLDLGAIALQPGGAIAGRVVDEGGAPVRGASVQVTAPERKVHLPGGVVSAEPGRSGGDRTRSDAEGRFWLRGLAPGFVRVDATLGERRGRSGPVEVRAGMESYDLVLVVLQPQPDSALIRGLVLDPAGRPVSRADLRYSYRSVARSGSGSVTTDRSGGFRVDALAGMDYTLLATGPGGELGEVEKAGVRGGAFVVMRLPAARQFAVELRSDDDTPIRQATLGLRAAGTTTNPLLYLPQARSTEGRYTLRLPAIRFEITAAAPGFEERTFGPHDPDTLPGALPVIRLRLPPAPVMVGQVTVDGAPAADVDVGLHRRAGQRTRQDGFPVWLESRPEELTRTGADGRFVLTVRQEGPFFVRAQRAGFAVAELGPFTGEDARVARELSIALGPGGSIRGQVRSASGRSPAGTVVGISRGDGAARTQRVGGDGRFAFEHLTPGRWMVERREEEILPGNTSSTSTIGVPYREVPTVCAVVAGAVTRYDLWLDEPGREAQGTLRGRLVVGDLDLAGWQAELVPAAAAEGEVPVASGRLDRQGRFELRLAGLGEHRLVIADDSVKGPFGRRLVAPLRLVAGMNDWDLQLPAAALRGTGAPREATGEGSVAVLWEGAGAAQGVTWLQAVIGDGDGRFHLPSVPAGRCKLVRLRDPAEVATAGGRKGWVTLREVELVPGKTATVDVGRR